MYDVTFIADIYVPGGTNFQLAQNIRYFRSVGQRIGIIPVQLPHAKGKKAINHFVREVLSEGLCEIADPALKVVRTHFLIIDNPRLMATDLAITSRVVAGRILILVPFPPQNGLGGLTFTTDRVLRSVASIADGDVTWAPWSNLVRAQMKRLYPELPLTPLDFHPIVDARAYPFSAAIGRKDRIVLGRHSRPEPEKWPTSRSQFLKFYPASPPFEVRLLGIDARSLSAMIGNIPDTYRVFPYDSLPVTAFLRSLDFFVYYHSRSWIEALGIVIVEAMASGTLCVLPQYMKVNFGDAAIYADSNDVREQLYRYHRSAHKYRDQTRLARAFVKREFSVARFATFAEELGIGQRNTKSISVSRQKKINTLYVSDYSSPKVFNHAFLEDIVSDQIHGTRSAVLDVGANQTKWVPAAANAFAQSGVQQRGPGDSIVCEQAIINDPWRLVANATDLSRIRPNLVTCVVSYPHGDLGTIQRYLFRHPHFRTAEWRWAPRDTHSRIWLESFDPNLPITPTNWSPKVSKATERRIEQLRRLRPITTRRTVGFAGIENSDDSRWTESVLNILEAGSAPIVTCFGERPRSPGLDPRIVCTGYQGIDVVKWVAKLDRLIIASDRLRADNLDYLVALAHLSGISVFYCSRNNKERATGSHTLDGVSDAELRRLVLGDTILLGPVGTEPGPVAKEKSKERNGVNGRASGPHPISRVPAIGSARPRLLFVSQNGTGVGHVVRQLAIARKMAPRCECVFLTMSQALPFISAFGFHAEYFPSSIYSGVPYQDWLHWLRKKVDLMVDAWGIRVVVFDGNVPFPAVAEASASRRHVAAVWIRRGMWPDTEEDRQRLKAQAFFDLVIEPRDYADDLDHGPTKPLRDTVHLVPPIQLLAQDELLSRQQACKTLGISPHSTNILVQLGSGNNRDGQTLLNKAVGAIRSKSEVRIYNLRWPISDVPPTRSLGALDLAVFPISRFYRAFDFSISAAGYNTAHEVLCHRLPTIFIPNTVEGMDNQSARAEFGAARGLSLAGGPPALTSNVRLMMDNDFRGRLRQRLRRLNLKNGAGQAAGLIDQLI